MVQIPYMIFKKYLHYSIMEFFKLSKLLKRCIAPPPPNIFQQKSTAFGFPPQDRRLWLKVSDGNLLGWVYNNYTDFETHTKKRESPCLLSSQLLLTGKFRMYLLNKIMSFNFRYGRDSRRNYGISRWIKSIIFFKTKLRRKEGVGGGVVNWQ